MKEIVLETNLVGWAVFVPVKRGMQGIPGRGMIKREGRHRVIYSIICMCTCGWSPSYTRRRDAGKGWIEEFCYQILENPECHMKDIREIQLRCAVWENRFGPCHQSAFTGALMAPKTFLRLLQPSYL